MLVVVIAVLALATGTILPKDVAAIRDQCQKRCLPEPWGGECVRQCWGVRFSALGALNTGRLAYKGSPPTAEAALVMARIARQRGRSQHSRNAVDRSNEDQRKHQRLMVVEGVNAPLARLAAQIAAAARSGNASTMGVVAGGIVFLAMAVIL
jgi:hypothetical protein